MKSKFTYEIKRAEVLDFIERLRLSYKAITKKKDKEAFRKMFNVFLPDGQVLSSENFVEAAELLFATLGSYTYFPGVKNAGDDKKFPAPCRYEMLIPIRQPKSTSVVSLIVPEGLNIGESTVAFVFEFPPHFSRTKGLKDAAPLFSKVSDKNARPILKALTRHLLDHKGAVLNDSNFPHTFGVSFTLKDEPFIRLPCYSVPLQINYERVSAAIGDFWVPTRIDELLKQIIDCDPNQTELVFSRKPLTDEDRAICAALLCWPTWQMARLSDIEQLEHLQELLALSNFKRFTESSAKLKTANRLRNACITAIRDHWETVYFRKVHSPVV